FRPDRRDSHAAARARSRRCRSAAAGQQLMRRLPGSLPGADRHPRHAAALARRYRGPRAWRRGRACRDRALARVDDEPGAVSGGWPAGVGWHPAAGAARPVGLAAAAAQRLDQYARFPGIRGALVQRYVGTTRRGSWRMRYETCEENILSVYVAYCVSEERCGYWYHRDY